MLLGATLLNMAASGHGGGGGGGAQSEIIRPRGAANRLA